MLHELKPSVGARKVRKRKGRGNGSGNGTTAGKGSKGQNARSGGGVRPGFEGGQIPFFQRIPKRGFKNINKVSYTVINISDLEVFEANSVVTIENLIEKGFVKKLNDGVKVLGNGQLTKPLTVQANKFSKSAQEVITNAGGKAEVI